jgi:hypothetical protein
LIEPMQARNLRVVPAFEDRIQRAKRPAILASSALKRQPSPRRDILCLFGARRAAIASAIAQPPSAA